MCAVFQIVIDKELAEKLEKRYGDGAADRFRGAELYPKSETPVIGRNFKAALLKWGFPVAGKSGVVINARAESLLVKPMFRNLVNNRCIVPAASFYEWGGEDGKKQRYRFVSEDTMYFAAIWGAFPAKDGGREFCFTIITTRPNSQVSAIHSRMPLILPKGGETRWLDPKIGVGSLLSPFEGTLKIEKA